MCMGIFLFHLSICHFYLPSIKIINFFPFYDWNLFSYNATLQVWPMIRVLEIDHKPVPGPGLIYHSGIIKNSVSPWQVPEQLIRLVSRIDNYGTTDEKSVLFRKELENNIFHGKNHVKYELFDAKINVREFFHFQKTIQEYQAWPFEYTSEKQ